MLAASSSPIVVLGSLAVVTVIFQITLLVIAIRAFVQGRDYVWECSWQWPLRVALALQALWRWCLDTPSLVLTVALLIRHPGWRRVASNYVWRFVPNVTRRVSTFGLPRPIVLPFNLPPALLSVTSTRNGRRPVRSQHYMTVGERMRAARRSAA